MNRNQKIIVSIVGITIVLLALLGITYAYYLTRIQGNTNTNSISITTADLKLVYEDGNGLIEVAGVMPGDSITKTFTVENTGENKVTGYTIVLENVVNELSRNEDLTYDLVCVLDNGNSCGESKDNLYPKTSNIAIVYANDIDKNVKHNYTLTVKYVYLDTIDQSDDMGSTISGKVNIHDAKDEVLNPYKTGVTATDNKSLAYNIIENARLNKNGTNLTGTSITNVLEDGSLEDESILATAQDNYGPTYYFRGVVEDNYVNFAGMCWRVVRINGDGSIKLILEDKNYECDSESYTGNWVIATGNFGYTSEVITDSDGNSSASNVIRQDYLSGQTNYTSSMSYKFESWQKTLAMNINSDITTESTISEIENVLDTKLVSGNWCYQTKAYSSLSDTVHLSTEEVINKYVTNKNFYYEIYLRTQSNSPTLKCDVTFLNNFDTNRDGVASGDEIKMYVGAITGEEVYFAGGKYGLVSPNYYLINQYFKENPNTISYFWTLTPNDFVNTRDYVMSVYSTGDVGGFYVSNYSKRGFRPVINLKSGTTISSGEGIQSNPYVIN